MQLSKNIKSIQQKIGDSSLVIVTKKRPVRVILQAIQAGAGIIGENRVGEMMRKHPKLKNVLEEKDVELHFIGHLQRNKAKYAVELCDMIQSLDSYRLARKIDREAAKLDKVQDVLVQVNIGEESQKYGIKPENTLEFVQKMQELPHLKVRGLMCMAPYVKPEHTRPYFKRMKELFDQTNLEVLSMGMTNDYKVAIEEGSTMVRLGRAIFEG